jgi:zinc/manganese transport system permease protein
MATITRMKAVSAMNIENYLSQGFAWHALIASALVAIACGAIAPFVSLRRLSFAVHGTSELAFTGAAAGLLTASSPVLGAYLSAFVVATVFGILGKKEKDRDSSIGVTLAFGLGIGILLLSYYHGFSTQATNILFGNIFGVSGNQLLALFVVAVVVMVMMAIIYRPLLFASVDPEVAQSKGVRVQALGILFLYLLAFTVTSAAQIVGTLLVLSLAITPAVAAKQFSNKASTITLLSIIFALLSSVGGILASLESGTVKPSIFVTGISFFIYLISISMKKA